MCTVSWVHDDYGYHLLCNRDEKRSRPVASLPQIHCRGSVRFAAPVDGAYGGTWIAVNEYAVSLCLLNGNSLSIGTTSPTPTAPRSRGLLLAEYMDARSVFEVCDRLWAADLSRYAPFTLVTLEANEPAAVMEWDGVDKLILPHGDAFMPLISSSFDPSCVLQYRKNEFQRRRLLEGSVNSSFLFQFHKSHGPVPGPYSPCMHRSDAETVSFSWIQVTAEDIRFLYTPAAPCRWLRGESLVLPRLQ